MWIVPTFLLFEHQLWAVLPAATFVLVNASRWQFGWIRSMEGERRNIGVILYPLSTALALGLFWTAPSPVVGSAAILVMCWGDAAAAIVGRRWGKTHYVVLDHQRSLEGSAAMFCASTVAVLVSFSAFGAPVDSGVVVAALITALAATLVEALPYIREFEGKTVVIKYGGSAMDNPTLRRSTAEDITLMKYVGMNPIIVHGGGPHINANLKSLNIESSFHNGLRVTNQETVGVVEMTLAGSVNKDIVTLINQAANSDSVRVSATK